ncbi:hypothetical protein DER44DRAFT_882169 [Fusarium oxysporum]|nr:hypothetical protein DER44DRAFT_882169 [Fusarium oxysporum]
MQSQKTSWGSNLNDFGITAKAKAVHTQQPKVANMFDEFSNAIEAMAEGLDNNSPDEDTAFVDAPPQEAIDIEEVPNGVPRKMEAGDLRTLTKAIMVASKCTLESNTNPIYVGQAAAVKLNSTGPVGVRKRAMQHHDHISPGGEKFLHVHQRLSEPDIERVDVTVLSMFPYPTPDMGEEVLRHYTALLTLVETIDVLLIDSLFTSGFSNIAVCIGSWEGLEDLRPPRLPRRSYEGLNRALPCNQGRPRLDGLVASLTWSPHDLELMIEIVDKHEQDVHVTSLNGIIKVDFETIVSQLELRGVRKTKAEVVKGYRMLASNPNSGLTTCKTGTLISIIPLWMSKGGFWATYLPRLLRREVWERITETAPERIIVGHQAVPKRLFNRALMVVLHFTQRRCTVTSDTVIVPRFEWSGLIEIWHQAFAQLIADGVPRSEILVGGACQIARLLNAHRRRLRDPSYSSTLPPWKYDDSKKASEKPAKLQPRFVDEQSPGHHRSVFDKYSESYAGDDTFWEIIFVELGKKWNIETQAQLQHRFGWVLKYLRSGELPEEAKTASQILQECLSNSVLSSEKHPYRRRGRSRR